MFAGAAGVIDVDITAMGPAVVGVVVELGGPGGLTLRWVLRRLLERPAGAGAGAGGWAARAWATHCWIRVVTSGVFGTMAGVGTMLGSEAVSETVGTADDRVVKKLGRS